MVGEIENKNEKEEEIEEKIVQAIIRNISEEDGKEIIKAMLKWDTSFKLHVFLDSNLKFKDYNWVPTNYYVNYQGYNGIVLEFRSSEPVTLSDFIDNELLEEALNNLQEYKHNKLVYEGLKKYKKYLEYTGNPYPTLEEQLAIIQEFNNLGFKYLLEEMLTENNIYYFDQETANKLLKTE